MSNDLLKERRIVGSLVPDIVVVVGRQSPDLMITTDSFNPSESTFAGRRNSYLRLEVLTSSPVGLWLEVRPRRCDDLILRLWVERGGGGCSQLSIMPRMEGSGGAAHSGSSPLGLLLVVGIVRHSVLLSSTGISGDGDD